MCPLSATTTCSTGGTQYERSRWCLKLYEAHMNYINAGGAQYEEAGHWSSHYQIVASGTELAARAAMCNERMKHGKSWCSLYEKKQIDDIKATRPYVLDGCSVMPVTLGPHTALSK